MPGRMRRPLVVILVASAAVAAGSLLPIASSAAPDPDKLERRIDDRREAIERRRHGERVLTTDISAYTRRIAAAETDIADLRRTRRRLQGELNAAVGRLERMRAELRTARMRVTRLRDRVRESRTALAARLVELYKADRPDLITLVLDSTDFSDLLERTELLRRISAQDARTVDAVRDARTEALAAQRRFASLTAAAQKTATTIAGRRDEVAVLEEDVVQRQAQLRSARDQKSQLLASVREDRRELETKLAALERESARVQAALARAATRNTSTPHPPASRPDPCARAPVRSSGRSTAR